MKLHNSNQLLLNTVLPRVSPLILIYFSSSIAFLYVSDDMTKGKILFKKYKKNDLFFVGTGNGDNPDDIGHDFALLVHSNHTVTSHGSFSLWAHILNNGDNYSEYGFVSRSLSNYMD